MSRSRSGSITRECKRQTCKNHTCTKPSLLHHTQHSSQSPTRPTTPYNAPRYNYTPHRSSPLSAGSWTPEEGRAHDAADTPQKSSPPSAGSWTPEEDRAHDAAKITTATTFNWAKTRERGEKTLLAATLFGGVYAYLGLAALAVASMGAVVAGAYLYATKGINMIKIMDEYALKPAPAEDRKARTAELLRQGARGCGQGDLKSRVDAIRMGHEYARRPVVDGSAYTTGGRRRWSRGGSGECGKMEKMSTFAAWTRNLQTRTL